MPVVELGTINSSRAGNAGLSRVQLVADQLQLRDDAWWAAALYTSRAAIVLLSLMLLAAAAVTAGDTPVAPTAAGNGGGNPTGSALALTVPGHPEVPPCAGNRFFSKFADHAPFRFTAASVSATATAGGSPPPPAAGSYISCGWGGGRTFVRAVVCLVSLGCIAWAAVEIVPGQWPWERCRLYSETSPASCGYLAAAGYTVAAVMFILFISALLPRA